MPTSFSSKSIGETIAAAHVNALQDAVNDLESGSAIYFVASGSSNAYTGTLSPAVSTLTAGFAVAMRANHDNTGAATLDLNGTGAVGVKKTDGSTDVASGDLQSGQVYLLVHDGTYWQVVGGGAGQQGPQPLATTDSPQFAALGVGTDPDLAAGIALDIAGGAIRVANPEADETAKSWNLLSRCYDTDEADWVVIRAESSETRNRLVFGSNSASVTPVQVISFYTGPLSGDPLESIRIDEYGNSCLGVSNLAPTATGGFLWIPGGNGTPTGTPGGGWGGVTPIYYDMANDLLYAHNTTWKPVGSGTETVNPATCDARLTLTSGVPVTTADVTGASTVYLTPYRGCLVSLYDGSAWAYHTIAEKSLALSDLTSGKNYDVLLHDASGTLTLTLSSAWTDDTTRADALAYQDGVRVLASDHTKRLVGTIRATGETTTESSLLRRFVVNEAHPLPISCSILKSGDWSYDSNTWRYANNDSSCKVEFLCGSVGHVEGIGLHLMRSAGGEASISIDNSTGNPAGVFGCYTGLSSSNSARNSQINAELSEGYHFLGCVEVAWGGTYYCAAAGLKATIWA